MICRCISSCYVTWAPAISSCTVVLFRSTQRYDTGASLLPSSVSTYSSTSSRFLLFLRASRTS